MKQSKVWEKIKAYRSFYTWPMNVIVGEEYINSRPEGGMRNENRRKNR